MKELKPLLASPYDQKLAKWPMFVSPKLDGIRILVVNSQVVSRKLIPIPNPHVQHLFGRPEYEGLDGELLVGAPNHPQVYNRTQAVMAKSGEPDVTLHLFDDFTQPEAPFESRLAMLRHRFADLMQQVRPLALVPQAFMASHDAAMEIYKDYLDAGFEGVMFRRPEGVYKFGRSTSKEGILLKHKPLADSEAEIIEAFEQLQNNNEAELDNLGRTKRSSHAENKVGKGTLGGLKVRDMKTGVEFNIGIFTGWTNEYREQLWAQRDRLPGNIVKYQYLPVGVLEKPRHPRAQGFRDPIDM